MIYIVLPFLSHLVLSTVQRAQSFKEKSQGWSPLIITSLSNADSSTVTHPSHLVIRMLGSTSNSNNPHALVFFWGCRNPRMEGALSVHASATPTFIPPSGLPMSVSPEIYVARGAEKPRNSFPSEPCFSLGHPIIRHQDSQHQDIAHSWNWRNFRGRPQAHTGSPEERAPERRRWILTLTPPAP